MPKNVLVVDDSAMMRKIVIKNVREAGFDATFIEASDGKEGLDKFQAGGIDIVLTDWNMPNMDGVTMVKEIRKLDPEKKVPIVMVTTEGSADKVKEAVLAGANNYLAKPFTPERLREKLGKMFA
ncbi:MAG: response regulator [Planctomycetota bacterium]|nr:MAG: response regulator [Planctomycetota bacterium]